MFEGLFHRVLVGYLGRYVKDFQKDQLKLSFWNEEVLLENVELIPEAFDYLQLPFALKQGRVGRLSIKISWKKLGWDPSINVVLEDVFICASERDDHEWSVDAVEKREFAGKKAQLAAAELGKLSRRVDNQAGKSFISYITAKVLDSIQVSIKNFHVQYDQMQSDSAQVLFGIKFSSLSIKQNTVRSSKLVAGQVDKTMAIGDLEIYCTMFEGAFDPISSNGAPKLEFLSSSRSEINKSDLLLQPLNISVSIGVSRLGQLDDEMPQYSITTNLTSLAISLNEVQLQQLLLLSDHLSISHLREKYGRYRPWGSPLFRKCSGWQKLWWKYAQESVLSDVRRKLKKTSWRYLGQRLSNRRRYINLYKTKLNLLQQEQPIDESILWELEQMEKEADIDDILSYRSAAECELQEASSKSSSNIGVSGTSTLVEKRRNEEHSLGKSRGWLNWLSRGMLGAVGTDDSSQFSGVVSDEVVKDIYEVTQFHPPVLSNGDAEANVKKFTCAIKFNIDKISATVHSKRSNQKIGDIILQEAIIDCKLWEGLATIICLFKSGEMVYPCDDTVILQMAGSHQQSFCTIQVDSSPGQEIDLSVKVMVQPLEVVCNMDFIGNLMDFLSVLNSFQFQHERVLLSLNGIDDVKTRLFSKAEYILLSNKRLNWEVSFIRMTIIVPCRKANSEPCKLVLELGSVLCSSKYDRYCVASSVEDQYHILKQFVSGFDVEDLYNYFEVKLNDFEVKLLLPQHAQGISILESFSGTITLASCKISDEVILKQLRVTVALSPLTAAFSLPMYECFVSLNTHMATLGSRSGPVMWKESSNVASNQRQNSVCSFSLDVNLDSFIIRAELAKSGENSYEIMSSFQRLHVRFFHAELEECWVSAKALVIIAYPLSHRHESVILCSSGSQSGSITILPHQVLGIGLSNEGGFLDKESSCTESFLFHYKSHQNADTRFHECSIGLNDANLNCYPYIFGLLVGFHDRISSYGASPAGDESASTSVDDNNSEEMADFEYERFGYSNFVETATSDHFGICLDTYPFITIYNSGSLGNLQSSLRYSFLEWRNLFMVEDRKLGGSGKFSLKRNSETSHVPMCSSGDDVFSASGSSCRRNLFNIRINLCSISVTFHDSSRIVGTLLVPACKSSLLVCDDFMDVLSSAEGLTLTSSFAENFQQLWGPSVANLPPILNVRVRKGNTGPLTSQIEVSFGIQHVCCILPPEYLAFLIYYFSLPAWSPNLSEQSSYDRSEDVNSEKRSEVVYKFEVLDSILISPVERYGSDFLKVELPQLYCSFIDNCSVNDFLKGIPPECMVSANKVAKANNCLNIFGRDLLLSLLSCKSDEKNCLKLGEDTGCTNIPLIGPLNADVWVRLPHESESCFEGSHFSTCIMSRIEKCQIIADDWYTWIGFEGLLDVISQFSSVDYAFKNFNSDDLWNRALKSLKETGIGPPVTSNEEFIEVQCCTHSLSIAINYSREVIDSSTPMAKADIQFIFSASLINETLTFLDLSFSSFALRSLLNTRMLAQCTNTSSPSFPPRICFSKSTEVANELHVSLPSLDIWLHLGDWSGIINLYNSYANRIAEAAKAPAEYSGDQTGKVPCAISQATLQNMSTSTDSAPQDSKQDPVVLTILSDDFGLIVHFPVDDDMCQDISWSSIEEGSCRFISVTANTKSDLIMDGKNVKLQSNLKKISGILGIWEGKSFTKWPLFQTSQVSVLTEIYSNQMESAQAYLCFECDRFDVWLSHQVFCFWYGALFQLPEAGIVNSEAGTPMSPLGNVDVRIHMRKVSFLISDQRRNCGGPLLEILFRNFLLHATVVGNTIEGSATGDLEVNYSNIHKVLWESFVEPWKFQLTMIRKLEMTALLNSSIITDLRLTSTAQLNLNFTESLIECVFRIIEMFRDASGLIAPNETSENLRFLSNQLTENICEGRYAPYVLQNLTSLPLVYRVYEGLVSADELDVLEMKDAKPVQPGASSLIYLSESPEEQLFRHRPAQSSDRLCEKQSNGVFHHFMSIQLEGTSLPASLISMDLVGLTYFEVDFSNVSNNTEDQKAEDKIEELDRVDVGSGFVVPVVFDVSVQRYSKLIRLYSTVILLNATSVPLEVRFDIPFGVSPKILDPIYPGQQFPLPLHLAEAGRMRWRPLGNSYLWSEVHELSNILLLEKKIGVLRSFVCYPSHPSNDPFRCCISVQTSRLSKSSKPKKVLSLYSISTSKRSVESPNHDRQNPDNRFIRQLTLVTPLLVRNYLTDTISVTVESGGLTRTALLSEVETAFHHVDPSHDLVLEFYLHGFRSSTLKFPCLETFSTMAKLSGAQFSQTETVSLDYDLSAGPLCVMVEKVMDAFSGARELFVYVPFLLYNCTGFPLFLSETGTEVKGGYCTIPSCYDLIEQELLQGETYGLSLLSSDLDRNAGPLKVDRRRSSCLENRILLAQRTAKSQSAQAVNKTWFSSYSFKPCFKHSEKYDISGQKDDVDVHSGSEGHSGIVDSGHGTVKACMYSPCLVSFANEIVVRVSRCLPHYYAAENMPNSSWSGPFHLVPPSGSSTVLVPQPSSDAAFVISVTSGALGGPFAGRTQAISFQPRYVICNACSKDLCFKQKGTDISEHLSSGQHSHLHWPDTTRELLISVRFNEPGWQWSGSFLPDHLGDTQVKMWNYVSGAVHMIRVEVQNADISNKGEKVLGSLHGNSGTNLILLSDDDTGFMPYRIENFTKEKLRVYQQKCETFDTIVHSCNVCPYAWDEPCYPRCLTVEVPGERVVGLYALDDLKEYPPVCLKSTHEKPERTFHLSVHADGATKVLRIFDSSHHIGKDLKDPSPPLMQKASRRKSEDSVGCKEKISLAIPCVGISLINSCPQELLYACAKEITFDLLQSPDEQKLSFQISSLQIDNQLLSTPYPVVLSFNQEYRGSTSGQRTKDDGAKTKAESSSEPVLHLAVSKWRKKDISLVSFEHISLRVADFRLELEQELILSLLEFFKAVVLQSESKVSFLSPNSGQISSAYLSSVVPIGAPWQQISLLARRQKMIYIELFDLAPIKFTLSFSSSPWIFRDGAATSGESLIHRGLVALADVEGARIHLKRLTISHKIASWPSMQDILVRHYTRQFLHEMYKVFGSAGVIGNPMGFARSLGLGIKDFLSVPARSILQSPSGLITGMAQGTTSLLSNTVYALSDAAAQFSKAAHKGIVAFTFNDQSIAKMEKGVASHSKGVISEVLEGLTGLLQSPIKEAEKHGLPGVLSGMALGVTGLVAKPAASVLEVTWKTAESIRNRSMLYQVGSQRYRVRLPRPLSRELPLRPYSLEEAVGTSVLMEADESLKLKDEVLVMCKSLKQSGKFVVITRRIMLIVSCPSLVDVGKPEFRGIPMDPEWLVESDISLGSIIHVDNAEGIVHIVGSSSGLSSQSRLQLKKGARTEAGHWNNPSSPIPFFQKDLELASEQDAVDLLHILLPTIEQGNGGGWGGGYILHKSNVK